jgi:hypothetical protein
MEAVDSPDKAVESSGTKFDEHRVAKCLRVVATLCHEGHLEIDEKDTLNEMLMCGIPQYQQKADEIIMEHVEQAILARQSHTVQTVEAHKAAGEEQQKNDVQTDTVHLKRTVDHPQAPPEQNDIGSAHMPWMHDGTLPDLPSGVNASVIRIAQCGQWEVWWQLFKRVYYEDEMSAAENMEMARYMQVQLTLSEKCGPGKSGNGAVVVEDESEVVEDESEVAEDEGAEASSKSTRSGRSRRSRARQKQNMKAAGDGSQHAHSDLGQFSGRSAWDEDGEEEASDDSTPGTKADGRGTNASMGSLPVHPRQQEREQQQEIGSKMVSAFLAYL